jgi:CHAD domain-containing protein
VNTASAYSQHIKKRSQRIYDLVSKPSGVYSAAYFHQLRVEIKKMNAALRIVNHCSPDFPRKKIFQPYQTLGKSAGEVREIQLEESAIRKLPPDKFIANYLLMLKEQRLEKKKSLWKLRSSPKTHLKKE